MKHAHLFHLIGFTLLVAGIGFQPCRGQDPLDRLVSVDYSNKPLQEVLDDLSAITNLRFSYSINRIDLLTPVTLRAESASLTRVLADICRQTRMDYSFVEGYVVLKPAEKSRPVPLQHFTVSGVVKDSATGELIIGSAVFVKETGRGVITNNFGYFSLRLPAGKHQLQAAALGYRHAFATIDLGKNLGWTFHLPQAPVTMKEIVVNPMSQEQLVFSAHAGHTRIDPISVQRRPAALGESDFLKSLDQFPGIGFQGDGSSFFHVRGGHRDQNLILLDDAPIFNPSHLLGLFTPVIPEAVKHAEIYRADFPVQFGGRLSSVIDIRARDGNMQKLAGSASVSPISARFSLEGPFKKDISSWFLSLRLSTFGALIKAAEPSIEKFYFTDFNAKFNFRLGSRNRIYLTLFSDRDEFINRTDKLRNGLIWGNSTLTLRWSHEYGSRLFSNTTLFASQYHYSLYTDLDKDLSWNSDITGSHLKSEFTWYQQPGNKFRFGFQLGGYFFNPGNYSGSDPVQVSPVNSVEPVIYAGHEVELSPWFLLNLGIRAGSWNNYGEAFQIAFNADHQPLTYTEYAKGEKFYSHAYFEPRISVSLKTSRFSSLKASYNRTVQHINQISNSISPFNSFEVWMPAGLNIEPQWADVLDLGWLIAWPEKSVDLYTDVYLKKLHNQIGYAYHAEMFLNSFIEGQLRQGDGEAYGFEILLRKQSGRLTGHLGYAFTRSRLHINDLNNNLPYLSQADRPVDLSFGMEYKINRRWTVNLNAQYSSGMTLTTPTGFYFYRGSQVPLYTSQNNDRLPDYRRIDLGSVWQLNRPGKIFTHFLTLTVYNALFAKNYAFLAFNKTQTGDGKFVVPSNVMHPLPLIPTYRFVYAVIPSLTYSLKF